MGDDRKLTDRVAEHALVKSQAAYSKLSQQSIETLNNQGCCADDNQPRHERRHHSICPNLIDLSLIEKLWNDERIIKNYVHLIMTCPLARIESHPQEAKRLIGIDYEQFLALVDLAKQRHLEKLSELEKTKIRIIASGGGRKEVITTPQKKPRKAEFSALQNRRRE